MAVPSHFDTLVIVPKKMVAGTSDTTFRRIRAGHSLTFLRCAHNNFFDGNWRRRGVEAAQDTRCHRGEDLAALMVLVVDIVAGFGGGLGSFSASRACEFVGGGSGRGSLCPFRGRSYGSGFFLPLCQQPCVQPLLRLCVRLFQRPLRLCVPGPPSEWVQSASYLERLCVLLCQQPCVQPRLWLSVRLWRRHLRLFVPVSRGEWVRSFLAPYRSSRRGLLVSAMV